jgi:large subunit ribosomal protein L4
MTVTIPTSGVRRPRPEPARRVVERRRIDGSVIDAIWLDPDIFGLEPNIALMHQVVTAQLGAARSGTQSTRTRAEVSGGGAKPFRQKGTGRARQGSTRSPQWSGGGVALGPKPRSYRQRTPKKMIRLALYCALSDRAAEGKVAVVDEWSFPAPKTKDAVTALDALGLTGSVLVVLGPDDGIPDRSFANLPAIRTVQRSELNAYDVLRNDWVVFTDDTLLGVTAPAPAPAAKPVPAPKPAGGARKTRPTAKRAAAKTETDESETRASETPLSDTPQPDTPQPDAGLGTESDSADSVARSVEADASDADVSDADASDQESAP